MKHWIERFRRKRAIRRLRSELAFWGIDTSAMTDEELAERAAETHRAMAEVSQKAGLTADEFAQSCADMGRAMRESGPLHEFLIPLPERREA